MQGLKVYISLILFLTLTWQAQAQLPVFSQKQTITPIFNPSLSGLNGGGGHIIYRNNYGAVNGVKGTSLIGGHLPFWENRTGVGANLYQDNWNFKRNTFVNASFAYHLNLGNQTSISMGLAGEYSNIGFDPTQINFESGKSDAFALPLFSDPVTFLDFATGLNFSSRYFTGGASINRMSSVLNIRADSLTGISSQIARPQYLFYTIGTIPARSGIDLIEPIINVRYEPLPSESSLGIPQTDIGVYYTYNNMVTLGGSYGLGNSEMSLYLEGRYQDFSVGFNYSNIGRNNFSGIKVGSNIEVNARYHFSANNYQTKWAGPGSRLNVRAVSGNRKTFSSGSRVRPKSFRNYKSKRTGWRSKSNFKKKRSRKRNGFFSKLFGGNSYSKFSKSKHSKFTRKKQKQRRKSVKRRKSKRRNSYGRNQGFFKQLFGGKNKRRRRR